MSLKDISEMEKRVAKDFKKSTPSARKRWVQASTARIMFNYGPSSIYGELIRPGYAFVAETDPAHTKLGKLLCE